MKKKNNNIAIVYDRVFDSDDAYDDHDSTTVLSDCSGRSRNRAIWIIWKQILYA